jgi:hypothetical protein
MVRMVRMLSLSRVARAIAKLAMAALLAGCAGGGPLLYPAKTMAKGEVRAAAGLSGEAIAANYASALEGARNEAAGSNTQPTDAAYARGALVAAAVNPGVAPFLAARVGLGHDFEAGLAYTGRSAHLDVRHSFNFGDGDAWAASIGVGGTAALYGRLQGTSVPGVDPSQLKGWGADLPVLVGYSATDNLYMVWFGARAGWEHDVIQQLTTDAASGAGFFPPVSLRADRFWGGPVLGAAAGFRHIHIAFEVDATYETILGTFGTTSATVSGIAIVPAGALWWDF